MGSRIIDSLLIPLGTIFGFIFFKLTYDGLLQKFINNYFSINKLGKDDQANMNLFFRFGMYFALYIISLKVLGAIFGLFQRLKDYASTIQRILLNSYDYFIIVYLLLFYLIRNKSDWDIKQKAPLYGFWFLSSRVIYAIGYLSTTLSGYNFKTFGVAMTYTMIGLMITDVFNLNGLWQIFDSIGKINLQL